MERSFYNDDFDFEQLIKQKSDQYKLYPSDKVWKGIYGSLHSSRRWYWVGFVLFIAGISYYTIDQLSAPPRKNIASLKDNSVPVPDKHADVTEAIILPFTSPTKDPGRSKVSENTQQKGPVIAVAAVDNSAELYSPLFSTDPEKTSLNREMLSAVIKMDNSTRFEKNIIPSPITDLYNNSRILFNEETTNNDLVQDIATGSIKSIDNTNTIVAANNELNDQKKINWLQENAVYEFTRPKLKRISLQLTLSPTMNYRKLSGNKNTNIASVVKNIPYNFNVEGDVDNLVNHKPALGLEFGSMFLYAVNKNITFKTGFQFNYSRYDIQAYSSNITDRATIALNNFYGTNTDSITTYTRLRNFGGNAVQDLKNEYYQLSAPIGVELLVLGRGRLQLSVAGTIQPTYLINRDNYLITTDYKNYTREPSLVRRWNVNTGAEAFISYKAAGFKFQLGPQLRYQLLSSYDDKYPVKEFLTEYGIKFGISKAIR